MRRLNRHHLLLAALALVWLAVMVRFGSETLAATSDFVLVSTK